MYHSVTVVDTHLRLLFLHHHLLLTPEPRSRRRKSTIFSHMIHLNFYRWGGSTLRAARNYSAVCVCVPLYVLHTEYHNPHPTSKVRTFRLLLTTSNDCVCVCVFNGFVSKSCKLTPKSPNKNVHIRPKPGKVHVRQKWNAILLKTQTLQTSRRLHRFGSAAA